MKKQNKLGQIGEGESAEGREKPLPQSPLGPFTHNSARSYDDYLLKGLLAALGPDQTDRVASYRKLSVWPRLACACDSLRKIVLNLFEFKFARK